MTSQRAIALHDYPCWVRGYGAWHNIRIHLQRMELRSTI